jgi:hypothetical protein
MKERAIIIAELKDERIKENKKEVNIKEIKIFFKKEE